MADVLRRMQETVPVQFEQILGLRFPLRHKHRQEHQNKQDGAHEHHGANEAKVVQGIRLHEQQAQESAHGGNVAHQQWIHLLRQGFPLVCLVFKMVHIMQRIIHGNAHDGAADTQHNKAYAALEQGNDAQGKERSGADGHQNPQHIREPFVTEPQDEGDEHKGHGQRQQGILFDAAGIFHRHFRCAGRGNVYFRILCVNIRLEGVHIGRQLGIPAAFTAAVRRMEQDNARFSIFREQAVVHQFGGRAGLVQPLQYGRIEAQRVRAHVSGLERAAIQGLFVILHFLRHVAGHGQQGIHAGIVPFFQEIGPVAAQELEGGQDGGIVCFRR